MRCARECVCAQAHSCVRLRHCLFVRGRASVCPHRRRREISAPRAFRQIDRLMAHVQHAWTGRVLPCELQRRAQAVLQEGS